MKISREGEATLLVLLAVSGWSFPGVFVRLMPHLDPLSFAPLRLSIAFLVVLPLALTARYRPGVVMALRSWRCWVLASFMLIYYLTATAAFIYAPVAEVALLIASAPIFTVIIRAAMRQPVLRAEAAGALIAFIGVVAMAAPNLGRVRMVGGNQAIGIGLSLSAAIAAACYAIGGKQMHARGESPGPIAQAFLTFCLGLILLPHSLLDPRLDFHEVRFLWCVPLGVFSTALPTIMVSATASRLSPVLASMINPVTSICASVVAALVIHEYPSAWTLIGGVFVICGVVLATRALTVGSRV